MSEEVGLNLLLGPTRSSVALAEVEAARLRLTGQRDAVVSRPEFRPVDPEVECSDPDVLAAAGERLEMKSSLHGFPSWRVAYVDLTQLVAFQQQINVGSLDRRLVGASSEVDWLINFALPAPGQATEIATILDPDGRGLTLSSESPNLRLDGLNLVPNADVHIAPDLPPVKRICAQFLVSMGLPYVQVMRVANRWLLRDGYHRAAGLLRCGIKHCPVVLIEGSSWEALGLNPIGFLGQDVIMGAHPPLVSDFWNDSVASDGIAPHTRKVVRLSVAEFAMP